MMISSGTASSAPVVPHTHAQKDSEMRIDSGLIVRRWPTTIGVKKLASIRWKPMNAAGGSSAPQTSGKVIRPPRNSSSARDDRPEIGDVIGDRDDAAPHHRRGHAEPPQDQRRQRAERRC